MNEVNNNQCIKCAFSIYNNKMHNHAELLTLFTMKKQHVIHICILYYTFLLYNINFIILRYS